MIAQSDGIGGACPGVGAPADGSPRRVPDQGFLGAPPGARTLNQRIESRLSERVGRSAILCHLTCSSPMHGNTLVSTSSRALRALFARHKLRQSGRHVQWSAPSEIASPASIRSSIHGVRRAPPQGHSTDTGALGAREPPRGSFPRWSRCHVLGTLRRLRLRRTTGDSAVPKQRSEHPISWTPGPSGLGPVRRDDLALCRRSRTGHSERQAQFQAGWCSLCLTVTLLMVPVKALSHGS